MRLLHSLLQTGCVLSLAASAAAASWSFTDATLSVTNKGSGVGSGLKEKLTPNQISNPVTLSSSESLKIILTTTEGKSAKKAHQAFLLLKSQEGGLDISYPFSVKETGKGKLDLTFKDIPSSFLRKKQPIEASIVIGSFGSTQGYNSVAFTLQPDPDTAASLRTDKPLRYGKLPEIHHIFRTDPKSPPSLISLVFALAAAATLPILLGAWLGLGGNINHLSKALSDAPVSHALFVGSIAGVEGVLFLYYTSWNLFQTLPVLSLLGVVALVSGSRALTEVQERRLAGLR